MKLTELNQILQSAGYPVAYRAFPENDKDNPPPAMPYICYLETGTNNFSADGIVYKRISRIAVELYTSKKDLEAEEKVEKALSSFYWDKDEEYLDDEKCYFVLYELEVALNG